MVVQPCRLRYTSEFEQAHARKSKRLEVCYTAEGGDDLLTND